MMCQEESGILMSSSTPSRVIGNCDHKFCESCFINENTSLEVSAYPTFKCPCCHSLFYANIKTIDEAILIGEALTIVAYLIHQSKLPEDVVTVDENSTYTNKIIVVLIDKLESALMLNPTNFNTLYVLVSVCSHSDSFVIKHGESHSPLEYDRSKLLNYSFSLLDHPDISAHDGIVRAECYYELACIFDEYDNFPAALKYSKLAYEHCLRSSDQENLSDYKDLYLELRADFAKLPPLRFAVGDEVEFLHELETGSEWKLGKVVELYYRERAFAISFNAPYRLQLLDDSDSADQSPVYAWVKADLDRYVRKVGVRSIEDTRYQARLDAKLEKLARVYCFEEFMLDIQRTLAPDNGFIEMLQSVWQVELDKSVIYYYLVLVVLRGPFSRTDSGYHMPSTEEVIAGIRALFDPAHLSCDAAPSESPLSTNSDSQQIRAYILGQLHTPTSLPRLADVVQGLMLESINYCLLFCADHEGSRGSDFTIPLEVSEAISRVSTVNDLKVMLTEVRCSKLGDLLNAWVMLHTCLENPDAGSACECIYVYFFVRLSLEQGWGVPKLALAVYDRMSMQLSREFIRCANPTCELNKLDKSTGKIKFKQCSRCKSVIYCSRDCQTAHYPEHKTPCREHRTG